MCFYLAVVLDSRFITLVSAVVFVVSLGLCVASCLEPNLFQKDYSFLPVRLRYQIVDMLITTNMHLLGTY